jgi:hypothetical protein
MHAKGVCLDAWLSPAWLQEMLFGLKMLPAPGTGPIEFNGIQMNTHYFL